MKRDPTLTVVDVGHGNAAVVRSGEHVTMIDVGGRNTIPAYCRTEHITDIDTILISHADEDHVGGLLVLLADPHIRLHRIRLNPDAIKTSALWDDVLWELDNAAERGEIDWRPSLTIADDGEFDNEGIRIEIIAPSRHLAGKAVGGRSRAKRLIGTNTMSVVVRISADGTSVLLCGDLDDSGLKDIVAHRRALHADVLVFPHHGGRPGADAGEFTHRLIELVEPQLVIFSIGRNRKPASPRHEIVEAIQQATHPIRIACTQLSVHCAVETPDADPKHLVETYARGKRKRQCCGGSIRIHLGQSKISPSPRDHDAFIDEYAPTALCRRLFDN